MMPSHLAPCCTIPGPVLFHLLRFGVSPLLVRLRQEGEIPTKRIQLKRTFGKPCHDGVCPFPFKAFQQKQAFSGNKNYNTTQGTHAHMHDGVFAWLPFEATPTTEYNTARRDAGCQDLLTLREGFTSSEYELYLEIFGRFDSKNGLQRLANSELHRMGERFTKF